MKKIWRNKIYFYNKKERKKCIYFFIQLIFLLLLTSCQIKPKAYIYMLPSTYEDGVSEIEVDERKYKEVLQRYEEILKQVSEDSIGAADVYSNMGGIYAEFEKNQIKAENYLNKAIKIHSEKKDKLGLAGDYVEMSKIFLYNDGNIEEGIEYLDKAEDIYIKLGMENSFGLAGAMTNKGHLYKKAGWYDEALNEYKKAQDIYQNRQEDNPNLNVFIGQIYVEMQEYELAKEQYLNAISINEKMNNEYLIAETQFQLGWLYTRLEDYNKAIEYYTKANEFYKTDEIYLVDLAITYHNIASAYSKSVELEKALDFSIKSYKTFKKIDPITPEIEDKIERCKSNMRRYYHSWSEDSSEDEFENWFNERK